MVTLHERFVVDKDGNQTAVLLEIQEYTSYWKLWKNLSP